MELDTNEEKLHALIFTIVIEDCTYNYYDSGLLNIVRDGEIAHSAAWKLDQGVVKALYFDRYVQQIECVQQAYQSYVLKQVLL